VSCSLGSFGLKNVFLEQSMGFWGFCILVAVAGIRDWVTEYAELSVTSDPDEP
jgi:hypothetical protein